MRLFVKPFTFSWIIPTTVENLSIPQTYTEIANGDTNGDDKRSQRTDVANGDTNGDTNGGTNRDTNDDENVAFLSTRLFQSSTPDMLAVTGTLNSRQKTALLAHIISNCDCLVKERSTPVLKI